MRSSAGIHWPGGTGPAQGDATMFERTRRASHSGLLAVLALLAAALPARAGVDVTLDAAALSELVSTMAPRVVRVPLSEGRGVTLEIHDFKVDGFDPAEGEKQEGFVLTSLRLKVPELSLDLPISPRLSLHVDDRNGKKVAYLRFEKVLLPLPITGSVDVAPLLPILALPTDTAWTVAAQSGNVRVRALLREGRMGARNLRLSFDLEATPAP
jgi:hypothetical protein